MASSDGILLKGAPFEDAAAVSSRNASAYRPLHTFELPKGSEKHYAHQFADMYFVRLAQLKEAVKQKAHEAWDAFELAGDKAKYVERVLDVRQGELCWVVGTVYMEMAMKPNVLDDISKEHWIAAPPPRQTYVSPSGTDDMMLEDESGRLRVAGNSLNSHYVTGCILAALGTEQADGSFQVIATQYADLPRQPQRWETEDASLTLAKDPMSKREKAGKLAIVSGLDLTGKEEDNVALDLLVEYLSGEAGGPDQTSASSITRLVIAGNSLSNASPILSREEFDVRKGAKRNYGYDSSSYNATPAEKFDAFLSEILPALPVSVLPGEQDPANVALPQQPLHPALFPLSRAYQDPPALSSETLEGLDLVTNPWEADVEGWRILGTAGQTLDDLLKYVEGVRPLDAMEMMLRWRCIAPTAPDTLWCYPFQDDDPLILKECPHIYFAGNREKFQAKFVQGPAGQQTLIVGVPKFSKTGQVVLVDMETLEVETVKLAYVKPRP